MLRQVITKTARNSTTTATATATCVAQTRSLHTPFAVLSGAKTQSNVAANSKSTAIGQYELAQAYEKQSPNSYDATKTLEESSTNDRSSGWTRLHIVCDPDPSHAPFGVKSGAYPVSEPFAN